MCLQHLHVSPQASRAVVQRRTWPDPAFYRRYLTLKFLSNCYLSASSQFPVASGKAPVIVPEVAETGGNAKESDEKSEKSHCW